MKVNKGFSYYDVEQFLKEAGAERINEKAIMSFKEELEQEVKMLLSEAEICATYAGRKSTIKPSDISLASELSTRGAHIVVKRGRRPPKKARNRGIRRSAIIDAIDLEEHKVLEQ
ncbi:MAG: hypothetical protein QXN59_03250 [Candidatus Micrarchaeaceae archaeon]